MPVFTMTSKYQATIPRPVRDLLDLGAGDRIEFVIEGDRVSLRKAIAPDTELTATEAALAPEWNSEDDDVAFAGL